jgi:hypothetical protein
MRQLGCFRDAAGANAGSADANVLARAIDQGANALKIWIPAAAAGVVRVTDHVAERRPLAANLASHGHDNSSPIPTKLNKVSSLTEFWPFRTGFDGLAAFGCPRVDLSRPRQEPHRGFPQFVFSAPDRKFRFFNKV